MSKKIEHNTTVDQSDRQKFIYLILIKRFIQKGSQYNL